MLWLFVGIENLQLQPAKRWERVTKPLNFHSHTKVRLPHTATIVMFKYISLLFFFGGVLGMIMSLSGFIYLAPSVLNLVLICMTFLMSACMSIVSGYELLKSNKN